MSLTRDQLRAARVLLHLQQTELAEIARIGVATIRRFESGKDVGHLYLDALRRAVTEAGVILIDAVAATETPAGAVGVALRPMVELPRETRARIDGHVPSGAADPRRAEAQGGKATSAPSTTEAKPAREPTGRTAKPVPAAAKPVKPGKSDGKSEA